MAEPLKNMVNEKSLRLFAEAIKAVYTPFPIDDFLKSTMDATWESLELKARGRQITLNMGKYLPADYREAISVLNQAVDKCSGMERFSFSDFVEVFGQNDEDWEISMGALERYTIGASSEFAVRPFIIKHEKRMMEQMLKWSKHENEEVRRLASEGCRPALPWGQALNGFKKDPAPILPILTQLKTDPSLFVRKSVANNLNDISKTHPGLIAKLAKDWYGKDERTNWIVKHGCRTLLKKGNRDVLSIFGYDDVDSVECKDFALDKKAVLIGESITFSFTLIAKKATKVRLEYAIDFVKANGKRNRKIFQISEIALKEKTRKAYTKIHSFADYSTRKHYPGEHAVTLFINGAERGTLDFMVSEKGNKFQW
ncbi:MAG: DNA alkylation repair protein [Lachnospiraceae bacterium]|nr:DNA alkylation repair protein [Lachnospiraceae bacterium]